MEKLNEIARLNSFAKCSICGKKEGLEKVIYEGIKGTKSGGYKRTKTIRYYCKNHKRK
ncbi:unnamed protein product [marine sediment metagenome]|uniref:Uncharacterized protein n=1 Tax=marine sediment metagenome TaxID=412755 RepID=X0VRR3_9ZZZZ